MGIAESKCVFLVSKQGLLSESYTVIRTSGGHESGWSIPSESHKCDATCSCTWLPGPHATLEEKGWRVFLAGPSEPNHSCGWRRIGTFWPSHLSGQQDAIDAWVAELKATLELLATQQGLPTVWEEHTCNIGAPSDMCPGCCGEREAKEKQPRL